MTLRERCEKFLQDRGGCVDSSYDGDFEALESFAREIRNEALTEAGDAVRNRGPFFKKPEYMWTVSDEINELKTGALAAKDSKDG